MRMRGTTALLLGCLAAMLAADFSVLPARAQDAGSEIVVAQSERRGFLRFLFGNRRQEVRPPIELPRIELFPGLEPRRAPRRERRARTAEPTPREVAAVEKAADAKRALVIGDFIASSLAKGLAQAYAENPNVVVVDATSGSSGLVRNDYYDWPAKVAEIVAEQKPDAILVVVGANDRQGIDTDSGDYALGTDGWRTAYAARVAAFADALKATGKPVLWGGLVPVESSAMSRDYSSFNGIVREQLEAKGLRFVETWNGFADQEGKFVSVGPDVRGQSVQLRASDGLNFTRAGQRKLAYFFEQELNDILGGAVPLLASAEAGEAAVEGGPEIGPMVPIDALSLAGGDALSDGLAGPATDSVSATISARLSGEDAAMPPSARADSFVWPTPRPAVVPPPVLPLRGPR